jgi:hypothetical protein
MKKILTAVLATVTIAAATTPVLAHHNANAQWHTEQTVELVAVLKEVRDIMPHAHWRVEVKGKDGKMVPWDLEAISANLLRRQGVMVKQQIKPGQEYTFYVSPSRDGSNSAFLVGIVLDGKRVNFVRL